MKTDTRQHTSMETRLYPSDMVLDADLVHRIGHGVPEAESELIVRFQRPLLFMLRYHTSDPDLATDIAQETFLIVIQRLRSTGIDQPERLAAFLHRTAKNLMIAHFRRASRRRTDVDTDKVETAVDTDNDQHAAAVREQEAQLVRQMLGELRCKRDREVLTRFCLQDEDKADICRELGLSETHFNRVLYRARKRFAALIEAHEQGDSPYLLRQY